MEVESIGIDFKWNSSIRYSSSWSAQIKKRKTEENNLRLRNHTFMGLVQAWVHHLERWFVGSQLERQFSVLISCFQCFVDCGCRGCFFRCRGCFFQRENRKETEVSWFSFAEIKCLILEFHVNFNRNRVCDTRFARVNSSSSAERCQFVEYFRNDTN